MPAPVLVTTDLDRTLIFSPGATRLLGGGLPAGVVEVTGGRVTAELAHRTRDALLALGPEVILCPATARTARQLARVRMPVPPRYAIVAHGGMVLRDGEPDRDWDASLRRRLAGAAPLPTVRAMLERFSATPWLLRSHDADGFFTAATVDPAAVDAGALAALAQRCAALGWRTSLQGRKLYLLPAGLGKAPAAAFVAGRVAAMTGTVPLRLAAGDGELDRDMLAAADLAWAPAGSDLARAGAQGARVTAAPGHAGAAQITAEWLEVCGRG